jgi:Fic family protein
MDLNSFKWKETPEARQLLIELEAVKLVLENTQFQPRLEENLRRSALLKSAVYSARIEGFPDTEQLPQKESQNLISAYKYISSSKVPSKLTISLIKKLHSLSLKNLSADAGRFRQEAWAVFAPNGSVVHLAPPFFKLPELMTKYIDYVNSNPSLTGIKAAIAQYIFEKIHPFADGNGRVGRLISAYLLTSSGYSFKGLVPFEEYVDSHRDNYYIALEPGNDMTNFITFFLTAIISQVKKVLSDPLLTSSPKPETELPLRRQEIISIVREHPYSSFNFICRRFPAVNPKTLHYDLQKLIMGGFIKKIGSTKGVVYLVSM